MCHRSYPMQCTRPRHVVGGGWWWLVVVGGGYVVVGCCCFRTSLLSCVSGQGQQLNCAQGINMSLRFSLCHSSKGYRYKARFVSCLAHTTYLFIIYFKDPAPNLRTNSFIFTIFDVWKDVQIRSCHQYPRHHRPDHVVVLDALHPTNTPNFQPTPTAFLVPNHFLLPCCFCN